MTLKIKILILLVCLFPWMRTLADPVVTTVGSGSICPETEIVIPVTVSNCNGVAAISLALNFDNTRVSYQGYQNVNNAVSTMLVNQSNGTIYMTWANMSAVNLGDGTLVELRFNSTDVSGNANLNWNTSMCEYSDVTGTALQASYYNGSVTVYGMPTITSNPSDLSLTEGQNSYFQVGASGQGVTYQWQVKTPVDNTWRDVIADSHHSNVNSYRLYVNNVTLEMDGNQYRCVVSGTCPSPVISRAATLSVASYIPTIVTSLGSVNTCFDQVFSIPVNVTNCNNVGSISLVMNYDANLVTYIGYENANSELSNGFMRVNAASGRVYFTWATSNQALQLGNGQLISFAFRSAAGNSNLTWNTSQCEYTNLVGNPLPASYNGSTLYINYPPSITSHPSNQTVLEGANTSFSITASGNSLSYQWQMSQDQGISWETLSNGTHYSSVTSRTLYVNDVVASMDGYRYRCLVNGSCDPAATSNYATLYVETQMSNVVTTAGSLNTCSQNEFGIPISVTGCNHVGAISLALSYNTNVLTYTGYEGVNPALSNGQLQVNAANGMVFIAWASIQGANVGNGNLLTLNFTALSGTSSLSWNTNYCEYANTQGEPFPATYHNGSVTVGDMSFTITSQPTNQTVTMEENATFSVATSGPTSGFQWQVSQDGGSSWSNVVAGDHYATPTTNTLTINNVPLEMNGYRFRCKISGDCGYQYTSVAILTVQLPPNYYHISLSADPEEGGTMEGAGAYMENTSCTVTAVPAMGYDFVNWTENGTEISTDAAYTFIVTTNRNLVAHFTLQEISINVSANPIGGGTINGGGTYLYGEHVLLTAIPITGSVFDNWTEDGEVISTNQSFSFTAQTDRTLVANFSVQQVNITATPVPASNGSIEGAGTYAYGSMVTLVAHAEQGFQLSTWTENGEVVGTSDTLSFMAENDRNLEANFITQQLHITAVADPEIGGTITGTGTYNYGDPVVLTAIPIGNSEFLFWKEDEVIVSDQPTYNFNAYEHRNLVAHFYVTVTIAATAQPEGSGEISGTGIYNYTAPVTLTASPTTGFSFANWMESDTLYATTTSISFTAYTDRNFVVNFDTIMHHVNVSVNLAEAGTVTGSGDYQEGSLALVSAVPNEHYEFVSWTENGVSVSTNPNYTFAVWGDRNLVANFSLVSFDVTATANPANGGEITGTGEYYYGAPCTLTATPNQGYFFENWIKDDSIVSTTQTYSFIVTEDVAFVANFIAQPTLDTTIYAEICYGEDYLQDGFEIYYPEVGDSQYSITLPSFQNLDSIVNLMLTVHPMYFFAEDTTLCNTTSYTWRGHTYTESGVYYDSLQTIHGCDSIYQLSLELFNTPLGEFTYMTPTNNYPFTSLPITFSWDAVSGAEYYNLYVWDADDSVPDEPFASNLRYGNYSTSALQNYHTYNWFVKARNACYEMSSSVKSFYLDITPSLNVNVNHIDFGEVAMNQSTSTTLNVTGIVLEDELDVQITGEDAAMFSFTQASGWNDYNGGILIVTFNPTTPQYDYNANLVVSSGTFIETVTLTGAVSDLYVFNTYVTEDVYAMNTQIPIYGSVTDWNNAPVTDAEVEIGVFVMGMKRTLQAMTDNSGQFSAIFEPMPSESGYYTVNSGRVGNHSTAVHDDFNIPGIAVVTSDYILCAVTQDQPRTDSILIRNKSNLSLSNIQVSPISTPDGASFSFMPLSLGGLEENWLVYTVTGFSLTQGNYYEEAKLKATSSEGAEMNLSIWYYCMEPRGVLDVMPKSLVTTMTKGKSKIVDVMLTNNGTGATGNIFLDLPNVEWMTVVGNDTLPSLAVNDTAYFSLRFSPCDEIPLVQYSGTIAINSERGDAVGLPYTITAVSDSTGMFVIDVTDDYTWNTNNGNGPHLEGAEVTLKGYYSLETVAQGYTDVNGIFQVDNLPEGYYRLHVEADHHSQYDNNILITAGETNHQNIYLQYQAITYSWMVEPTEIEDEYTYELNVVFETHVPVPVITIEHSGINDLEYGESANFNLIITNHGLINAFDTHIYFTGSSEYTFVPLHDVIDTLSALTTVVIPGTYYRTENRSRSSDGDCDVHCRTISIYYCNFNGTWTSIIENRSLPFGLGEYIVCHPESNGDDDGGVLILNGGDGDGRLYNHHFGQGQPIVTKKQHCTPCVDALVNAIGSCVSNFIPGGCYVTSAIADIIKAAIHYNNFNLTNLITDILNDEVECGIDNAIIEPIINYFFGTIPAWISCLNDFRSNLSECVRIDIHDQIINHSRDNMDNMQNAIDGLYYSTLYFSNELEFIKSYFPEDVWDTEENILEFFSQFRNRINSETGLVPESVIEDFAISFVGTSVTYDDVINFVNRWNRSVEYWSNHYFVVSDLPIGYDTNFIQIDTSMINYMVAIEDYYISLGYDNMGEVYEESIQNAMVIAENASQSSVCASVTVKFSQSMTMTREAFDGTFTVHNGHNTDPMEAIGLEFLIKDEDGNDCTNLFQINTTSLNNITGIDGSGSLNAGLDGIAKIMFIPTKYAAPTEPKVYYFGGTFSFIDPYTSDEIVYDLYPVEITVNPSPDLYVDYFMQRDILGDDALTLDVVEPTVPAELGVIIHNQGAGEAKNVTLETAEPQIIDNEKGLAIDFAMYGASFNGSPRQLGLMEIPFGNIESGQTAVGEWLFTSSLLGHFVSYEAHVIHNSSYGNSDLSLVSHLDIHELIHPIYAYGNLDDGINDFLVNDSPDAYDTPDSIYFSHGGKTLVGVVDGISFDHLVSPSDTIVTFTVVPSRVGWNYGVTDDPGMNQYNIVGCIRNNDNQVIPLNNVWLTFVTIPDGGDPVYENKLHIVDTIPVQQTTTYTLVFAKKPSNLRIFHGNEDEYWSNVANWEGYILPQADDEVLINGICELDEDAEVFSLTVAENKSLTIPDGRILTVSGSLTNADASGLVIEEGGQLLHTNTGAQGTVEKNILPYTEGTKDGWYLVSSPLAGFTNVTSVSDLLSNNYDLYYYDEPTHYWINQEYAANNFTELTNGKGYLYANNEEVMLGFEGELQSGSAIINVLLNYTDGIDLAGFNLVGNPYAHNVTSYASVNVANGCYLLNETKDDFIVSEISEENPLHPAEGFFVKATDEGASITFNSGRGAKANPGGSIRVELVENGKLIDRLIVKLEGEPLRKLSLNEIRTKVYATQDHQEVAIVNCTDNEQPVNFKASKNGEYTLNVNTNGLEFNYLHLIDNLTGADVDLLALRQAQGPMSYTFEAKTTDYASRFRLVFSICGDANGDNGDDAPFAFISNGNIIIVGADAHAVLQVVDVMGRVLVSRKGDAMNVLSTNGMAKGVYVLRLINGEDVKTQKIVID